MLLLFLKYLDQEVFVKSHFVFCWHVIDLPVGGSTGTGTWQGAGSILQLSGFCWWKTGLLQSSVVEVWFQCEQEACMTPLAT